MIEISNDKGNISISNDVFTALAGDAATNCFGVKGMALRSRTDGLVHLLRRESMGKGVHVTFDENGSVKLDEYKKALEKKLEQAVSIEDYESAAVLRDKIKALVE